jgi:uncharacterized membrane protein YfcA
MSLAGLIPAELGVNAVLLICGIALVSGTARGFSGFGSALIFMPLASSIAAPRLAAALLLIIDFVAALPMVRNAWRNADRKSTAVMVFGAAAGVPLGTYALTHLDPVTNRWIISAFVFTLLTLLISGWRYRGEGRTPVTMGVGALAGFCSGLAQTGGPPIVAYWLGRPITALVARANIILYFASSDLFSFASYTAGGLLTVEVLKLALLVGPVYAVGILTGAQMFGRASESLFRAICYSLIAFAALIGLPLFDGWLR